MNVDLEVRKLKLGEKVKDLRLQKRYTLRQVAGNTGLSIALLSQIENNAVSPPVATLLRIARALDVTIGYFFREEESKDKAVVVRKNERKKAFRRRYAQHGEGGYTYEALAYTRNAKHMEPFLVEFEPKQKEELTFLNHRGEEFLFLFRGRLAFHYDQDEIVLDSGDSLYFDSGVPHAFRALRGKKAQGIVIVYSEE
ncbi:MAG: cupin domain-containing protein [Deltaproteobacteria bacterium]|jgi:transcriptional regulator with XRE-family HTH domain|nr:cupin domain-containing protein [Deltaproteobacteria bacterium]MDO9211081.1 cupin domain-containing protein [Deltaproteobacteria bacterium]